MTSTSISKPTLRVLVFCKAPEPGKVKTRLTTEFSTVQAAEIHESLASETLEQMLELAQSETQISVELWCNPDTHHRFFSYYEEIGLVLREQVGRDLGEKMHHGFMSSAVPAIVIGTDCPPVDADYIRLAAQQLVDHDVVIGPAEDGGYGLIGLQHPIEKLFVDMTWSTSEVFNETLARCDALALKVAVLPEIWDVDFPDDVRRWRDL